MREEGDFFLLQIVLEVDQQFFGLVLRQQDVYLVFLRQLDVVVRGHYAELGVDC